MAENPPVIPGGDDADHSDHSRSDGTTNGPSSDHPANEPQKRGGATDSDQARSKLWRLGKIAAGTVGRDEAGRILPGSLPSHPPELKAQIKTEWCLGIKSVTQISREYGVTRTTIYTWAKDEEWPPRSQIHESTRHAIDQTVIAQAAADLRQQAGGDDEDATRIQRQLDALGIDPEDEAPESTVIVTEYALAVAETIRRHRQAAANARDVGEELLEMYRVNTKRLRAHFDRLPNTKKHEATLNRMELVAKTAGQYATLVRALQIAQKMEREAMGIERAAADTVPPKEGDAPSSSPGATQPGSYEEVVAEMHRREGRLDS